MNHAKTTCANITWETETETETETEAETETERDRERQRETERDRERQREGEIRALDDTFHNVLVSITTNGVLIIFTQNLIKKQLKNLEKISFSECEKMEHHLSFQKYYTRNATQPIGAGAYFTLRNYLVVHLIT